MGMLLTYHEGYRGESPEPEDKPLDRQNKTELQETARTLGVSDEGSKAQLLGRIKAHNAEPPADEPSESAYADLTDEQVLEAYATNIPDGEADNRDAMVAELDALDESAKD